MVEFTYAFPRFPLRKKESEGPDAFRYFFKHRSYVGKNRTHNFRTTLLAGVCAGYLLDHDIISINKFLLFYALVL